MTRTRKFVLIASVALLLICLATLAFYYFVAKAAAEALAEALGLVASLAGAAAAVAGGSSHGDALVSKTHSAHGSKAKS